MLPGKKNVLFRKRQKPAYHQTGASSVCGGRSTRARGIMIVLITLVAILLSAVTVEGLFAASNPGLSPAAAAEPGRLLHTREAAAGRDIDRVVSVLEGRIGGRPLPERAKERLASMDSRDFRLIVKLCDRIEGGGSSAGTDVALLLTAALIVLS